MGCVPWADRYMLPSFPRNEKRRLMPMDAASQKGDDPDVALRTAYITLSPKGQTTRGKGVEARGKRPV